MSNNTTGASLSISPARETMLRLAAAEMWHKLDQRDIEPGRVRQGFSNDILLEIFSHVCAIKPEDNDNGMPMALHLSQVCRRWREIALSNRVLWTTFTLGPSDEQKHAYLLQLYLTRSHGARLLFDIKNPPDDNLTEITLYRQALLSLTINHSRVSYREEEINANIKPSSMCDLPVESLILAGADTYQRFLLPFAEALLCPNLISLTLKATYASDNTPLVTFLTAVNPPNLHELDLGNISFSDHAISEVLSSVPLLQELSCSFNEQVPLSCFEISQGLVAQLAVVNFAFWYRPNMDALAKAFASRFVGVGLNSMTVAYSAHPTDVFFSGLLLGYERRQGSSTALNGSIIVL
ncbi:hypothetical protein DFS33DRAFT_1456480 [Desarmillaria ectypa]|nr:hypothetical protein DFS33DRAFT_1456480 [Desarmillaria ectypa]